MSKEKPETKICKYCKAEIPYGAKVCSHCGRKQGPGGCLISVIVVLVLIILFAVSRGSESDGTSSEAVTSANEINEETSSDDGIEEQDSETEVEVTYIPCTVDQLMDELNTNAMKASNTYKGQYLEVTGRLSTIDSSGSYISLLPDSDFAFVGIQCYLKDDTQKDDVMNMTIGDTITVRGKCTDVGEILGYSLDIDSFVQ